MNILQSTLRKSGWLTRLPGLIGVVGEGLAGVADSFLPTSLAGPPCMMLMRDGTVEDGRLMEPRAVAEPTGPHSSTATATATAAAAGETWAHRFIHHGCIRPSPPT